MTITEEVLTDIWKEEWKKVEIELKGLDAILRFGDKVEKKARADEREKVEDEFDVSFPALFGLKQKVEKAFNEAIEEFKEIHEHFREQEEEQKK